MSNTTPNTQTPTIPTNNQNVAVKQLTKEEVKAVAKFNQKKKDRETIRNENIKKMKNTASTISVEEGLFSPPRTKFQTASFPKPFAVGDYVEVMEDFSPNMNRHKGIGWVTQVIEKDDGDLSLTVQYDIGKHIFSRIPVDAVTKIPLDFSSSRSRTANSELKRKAVVSTSDGNSDAKKARTTDKFKGMTRAEVLIYGLSEAAKTNKRKGWYRIEFGLSDVKTGKERLTETEKSQILFEHELLSQHFKYIKRNYHQKDRKMECSRKQGSKIRW